MVWGTAIREAGEIHEFDWRHSRFSALKFKLSKMHSNSLQSQWENFGLVFNELRAAKDWMVLTSGVGLNRRAKPGADLKGERLP